jgi:hypothetical protein
MSGWGSYSYVFGPLVIVLALGLLILVLRWSHAPGSSLIERTPKSSAPTDYGALVSIAAPSTYIDGELQRQRLLDAGIKATLAQTTAGPRLLVFPEDEGAARTTLSH